MHLVTFISVAFYEIAKFMRTCGTMRIEIIPPYWQLRGILSMETALCVICGDFSFGKHYGVQTCLGCKQFFQRTVRDGSVYVCRFEGCCEIVKERRNQCRYCRFKKSLDSGMRREAVQEKRDKRESTINRHHLRSQGGHLTASTPLNLDLLFQAETSARAKVANMFPEFQDQAAAFLHYGEIPNIGPEDVYTVIKLELHLIVEWAKDLPGFRELRVPDQVALLRAHGAELITLETIRRSLETSGFLVTVNGRKISTDGNLKIRPQAIEGLFSPYRRLKPSNHEFLCLKALIIFDPESPWLSETEKGRVGAVRKHIQNLLAETCFHNVQRISDLLLFLPKVHTVGLMLVQVIKMYAQWWKGDNPPKLVEDIFLKDHDDADSENDPQPSTSGSWSFQPQVTMEMEPFPSSNMWPPDDPSPGPALFQPSPSPLLHHEGDSELLTETIFCCPFV